MICPPDGGESPNFGYYLKLIENRKLVRSGAILPGFRPRETTKLSFVFTAINTFESEGEEAKFTAKILHSEAAVKEMHKKWVFTTAGNCARPNDVGMTSCLNAIQA